MIRKVRKFPPTLSIRTTCKEADCSHRDQLRKLIKKKTEDEVTNLLSDHGYDPKGLELASSFSRHTSTIKPGIANDGTLVMYINFKLYDKFGSIASRDNATLVKSLKVIPSLIEEVRKMI